MSRATSANSPTPASYARRRFRSVYRSSPRSDGGGGYTHPPSPAEPRTILELAATAGPHAGRSFRFAEHATFIVGRPTQAHSSLPDKDPHVSRLHVLVGVDPPLCRVRNMGAVNGTVANGGKVSEADLKDGDRITIGLTELTVQPHTPLSDELATVGLPTPGSRPAGRAVVPGGRGTGPQTAPTDQARVTSLWHNLLNYRPVRVPGLLI